MTDKTQIVTPDAPRDLAPFRKEVDQFAVVMSEFGRHPFKTLTEQVRYQNEVAVPALGKVEAAHRAEIERAVRGFAAFLATTASPKGTIQREKLQSFATEFLGSTQEEKKS